MITSSKRSIYARVYLGVETAKVHLKTGNARLGAVTLLWGNNRIENQLESTQTPTVALNTVSLNLSGIIKALEVSPIDEPITIITINNTITSFFNKPSKYETAVKKSPFYKQMESQVKRVKELINTRYIKPKIMLAGCDSVKIQYCTEAKKIATSKLQEYEAHYRQEQGKLRKRQPYQDIYTSKRSTQSPNSSTNNHLNGSFSPTGSQPIPVNELKKSSISSSPLTQPPVNRLRKRKQEKSDAYLHLSQKSRRLLKKYKSLIDEESNNNSIMNNTPSISEKGKEEEEEEDAEPDNPIRQRQTVANSEEEEEEENDDEFVDATEEFIQDNQNSTTNQSSYLPTWIKSVYSSFKNSFNR